MIDDFGSPVRRKPKVIEPLPRPNKKLEMPVDEVIDENYANEDTPVMTSETIALDNEETATQEASGSSIVKQGTAGSNTAKQAAWFDRFKISWPPTKKQKIIGSALAVLLMFGLGAAWTQLHHTPPVKAVAAKPIIKATKAKPIYSTLTGLPLPDSSANQRPVTGVMIENSIDARPQSGLDQAGVVFEAIAEGGVTRFMALFQDSQPDYIGPVRSARPYYIQWCMSFDCSYAHVGGSPDGLSDIQSWGTKDLDQFYNSGGYQRISSRYAPHNVYTSIDQLNQLEAGKGFGASSYTGFSRKTDQPYKAPVAATAAKPAPKNQDARTPVTSIDFALSGYYYNPHFDYDAGTNSYKRSEAGGPHMEQHKDGSQVQITPKVVIGIVLPLAQGALDASGAYYSDYNPIGSGQAFIFQDGTVTTGTWNKADIKSALTFTDASGKPLTLNAGQTWITALQNAGNATYK